MAEFKKFTESLLRDVAGNLDLSYEQVATKLDEGEAVCARSRAARILEEQFRKPGPRALDPVKDE